MRNSSMVMSPLFSKSQNVLYNEIRLSTWRSTKTRKVRNGIFGMESQKKALKRSLCFLSANIFSMIQSESEKKSDWLEMLFLQMPSNSSSPPWNDSISMRDTVCSPYFFSKSFFHATTFLVMEYESSPKKRKTCFFCDSCVMYRKVLDKWDTVYRESELRSEPI